MLIQWNSSASQKTEVWPFGADLQIKRLKLRYGFGNNEIRTCLRLASSLLLTSKHEPAGTWTQGLPNTGQDALLTELPAHVRAFFWRVIWLPTPSLMPHTGLSTLSCMPGSDTMLVANMNWLGIEPRTSQIPVKVHYQMSYRTTCLSIFLEGDLTATNFLIRDPCLLNGMQVPT